MARDTGDRSRAAGPGTIHKITPTELDAVVARARDEKWTDLVLFGPNIWVFPTSNDCHGGLRGREIFALTSRRRGVALAIQTLVDLRSLALWNLDMNASAAKAISTSLTQLTSLDITYSWVGDEGAKAIATNLRHLTSLALYCNRVGDEGAKAIATNLRHLTSLDLSSNHVGDEGAKAIATNLRQLTSLDLSRNQVGVEGTKAIATNLRQLTSLSLGENQVGDEGAKAIAANMERLTSLDLAQNDVGDEGAHAVAEGLVRLERLDLAKNGNIRSGAWIREPPRLRRLNLAWTGVADLSPLKALVAAGIPLRWSHWSNDDGIYVYDCPLVHPTPEVVQQGQEAVLNYFREIEQQGVDHLYEAKVLLVGEGGAGKTSLLRRLYYPGQPLPDEEESTRGIDVHVQHFDRAGGRKFRLNLWDFGGQQIYHATHQFFLTRSSLYVLVDDTRKDNKSVHDKGFKDWLEAVEAFGDKSPVLIFQNEKGGRSKKIDEDGIKGRFPNVLQTLRGDLGQPGSAEDLRRAIEQVVQVLPHIGEAVPARWVAIRADIEEVAKQTPYISLDEYVALYDKYLPHDLDKAKHLSRYLHDIGVFLHFQDDLRLGKTVIVQNRWATEAVFRILDDEQVKKRLGYFDRSDCGRVWTKSEFASMHGELLALMERFELCYQLPGVERWLAPRLLCPSTPKYVQCWAEPNDLVLTYRYDFLPRGLVSRLMVRMHRFVPDPGKCWANGALFQHQGTMLLALTESSGTAITLRARGPEKKALLSVIASVLDELNGSFRGLVDKIRKWVPCVCAKCKRATSPELFDEQYLVQRRLDIKLSIECRKSYTYVSVLELLDGVRLDQLPAWATPPQAADKAVPAPSRKPKQKAAPQRTIKIFLASSEEMRADRDKFDLYFRQQNDVLRKRGLYLEIICWENFLDAMSATSLQDEYNREVRACDIFVALFKTKTGRFTDQEFDVAHAAFKKRGKPLIYTFFKKARIPTTNAAHRDLATLLKFQAKLKRLKHFWTKYDNTEHLKRQFKDQLDKLEANHFKGHPSNPCPRRK